MDAPARQRQLSDDLLADMEQRDVHPTIRMRLLTGVWHHRLVALEMIR